MNPNTSVAALQHVTQAFCSYRYTKPADALIATAAGLVPEKANIRPQNASPNLGRRLPDEPSGSAMVNDAEPLEIQEKWVLNGENILDFLIANSAAEDTAQQVHATDLAEADNHELSKMPSEIQRRSAVAHDAQGVLPRVKAS